MLSEELVAQHFGEGTVLCPGGDGSLQVPGCAGGLCASGPLSLPWVMQLQAQPLRSESPGQQKLQSQLSRGKMLWVKLNDQSMGL